MTILELKSKLPPENGFSVIEVMVVMAILSLLAAIPLVGLQQTKSIVAFQDAQASIIYALEGARNKSESGIGNYTDHGVYVDSAGKKIVIFEGSVYTPGTGEEIFLPSFMSINATVPTIIFKRLTSQAVDSTITLSDDNGKTSTVTISPNGKITAP